jgi:hypothetical protein
MYSMTTSSPNLLKERLTNNRCFSFNKPVKKAQENLNLGDVTSSNSNSYLPITNEF